MNKLLVASIVVTLLALSADGFRVARQAVEEDDTGTLTKMTNSLKSYYGIAINKVKNFVDSVQGLKLEEKIKNFYDDTTNAVSTYVGIAHDQIYHTIYNQQ